MDEDQIVFWVNDLDLSTFTYQRFTAFFFDRPIAPEGQEYNLYHDGFEGVDASQPEIVVDHLRSIFQNWAELANVYSYEQMAQGAGAILSIVWLGRHIFDATVPRELRVACIESMYTPFAYRFRHPDRANNFDPDVLSADGAFYMWWDLVAHDFALAAERHSRNFSKLPLEFREMGDALLQTLTRILQIEDGFCQHCALHGLGHLYHPQVKETVQSFIDRHRATLPDAELRYAELCRDNEVL